MNKLGITLNIGTTDCDRIELQIQKNLMLEMFKPVITPPPSETDGFFPRFNVLALIPKIFRDNLEENNPKE